MKNNINGRRKVALENLEKQLKAWNKHSEDKRDKNKQQQHYCCTDYNHHGHV